MQLAVERHRGQARAPDAVERRQELRTVLHRQRHARSGRQAVPLPQRAGDALDLLLERAIAERTLLPCHRRVVRQVQRDRSQRQRQVHARKFRSRPPVPEPKNLATASGHPASQAGAREASPPITPPLRMITVYHAPASTPFRRREVDHITFTSGRTLTSLAK